MSIDSRKVREGDLFVALVGDRTDGHEHVAEAFRRGAVAALISKDLAGLGGYRDRAVIRVDDTRIALVRLAERYRRELSAVIVGVTGSNGKTTVKDLVAHLLEPLGRVVKAEKSFNNDIGLPLTLLSMDSETRVGVVEIGTNHPGEIRRLCRIARPDLGVVTNVGQAHLAGLGGILDVAKEKGSLVEALPEHGMAFLNFEDMHCREMARKARCPVITFGADPSADLWCLRRRRTSGGISFYLYGKMEMRLPVFGLHNAMNALAAIGVALRLGVAPMTIRDRLATFTAPDMRLSRTVVGGVTLINDAYNANPDSVGAAIEELQAIPAEGRRILVLGDMFELGEHSARLHRRVGVRAARSGIDTIWAIGKHAGNVGDGAISVDRWTGEIHLSPTTAAAIENTPVALAPGDVVLVKGSRGMRLERLYPRLAELPAGAEAASPV
ncbi:MAG: UDP-N-acetylmuramoyl-tripeptide--D-alanyl-D-alanine ligase [Planctomycetota bacterium]